MTAAVSTPMFLVYGADATLPIGLVICVLPVLAGLYLASRREVVAGLEERARRNAREERLRIDQARAEERAQIARDMHDVAPTTVLVAPDGPALHVGFLLKDATADQMASAVRSAAAGDAMLSPRVTRRLLHRFAEPTTPHRRDALRRIEILTDKEREVLAAVGEGLPNSDIGRRLHLSEATVKSHVSRVLAKLQLTNRVQAAILAHHAGLVP
jgi:DNA-binding CsgD family transcriptional regulator